MKCPECGSEMSSKIETIDYEGTGLEKVVLEGVSVSRCTSCDEELLFIPKIEELHKCLAFAVATKPERLNGDEIRFLRKYLGFAGQDLADFLKVAPETVSRWENSKQPMKPTIEVALRLLALVRKPVENYPNERIRLFASKQHEPITFTVRRTETSWTIPSLDCPTESSSEINVV